VLFRGYAPSGHCFGIGLRIAMACLGAARLIGCLSLRWLPDFGTRAAMVMRSLSTVALTAALVMAVTSICFIAITSSGGGGLGHQLCTFAGPPCNRPSLLLIPTESYAAHRP
jgi:hypothetical protein